MASAVRSSLLRRACASKPLTSPAGVRSTAFSTLKKPSSSPLLRSTQTAFGKTTILGAVRVAAFHATSRRNILPPEPQKLNGTANEAAPVPTPSPTHGSYHWVAERFVAAALIPVTIAPFAGAVAHPIIDASLCALLVIHSHIGFQSCIIDYIPKYRMPTMKSIFDWIARLAVVAVAYGLYEFETNDVGITEAVQKIWTA